MADSSDNLTDSGGHQPGTPASPSAEHAPLRSEDLFRGLREILIVHAREVYRLRLTRNGKLILTK